MKSVLSINPTIWRPAYAWEDGDGISRNSQVSSEAKDGITPDRLQIINAFRMFSTNAGVGIEEEGQ